MMAQSSNLILDNLVENLSMKEQTFKAFQIKKTDYKADRRFCQTVLVIINNSVKLIEKEKILNKKSYLYYEINEESSNKINYTLKTWLSGQKKNKGK